MRTKIGIIGAGQVGAEAANQLIAGDCGDLVLIDIRESIARGKALDLTHASSLRRAAVTITGGADFSLLRGCDIIVMTAGAPRKPGMSRDDLLEVNLAVVRQMCSQALVYAPEAIWIMVTNPLDAMTYAAWKLSDKSPNAIMGMAGPLDTARFRSLIAAA
ncbi:MAG: malate dehydrogenase, partial [Chitinivibrionales bacterium]|nr:malate dehydrogenase [Chitinivibrionales bacterium]